MKKRVVVTGLGMISPEGQNRDENWQNITSGKCGFVKSELPEANFYGKADDAFKTLLSRKDLHYMDRVSQLAVAATGECLKDAGLEDTVLAEQKMAVCIGTAIGGMETFRNEIAASVTKGMNALSITGMPKLLSNMIGANITIKYGITASALTYNSACASSTTAIGEAFKKIQYGDADFALAGGSEACILSQALGSFGKLNALSKSTKADKASVPFSKYRSGFVMGEGGIMLLLEEYEHAIKRGAPIYCEVLGYGASSDGKSLVCPDPAGVKNCILRALEDSGVSPDQIEYINAHGTGTVANDSVEAGVLRELFGSKPYISSTKCYHGHLLGAAGAMESALIALMIKNKTLIGQINVNIEDIAEECQGINLLLNQNINYNGGKILNNSFGFGGNNAVLVFGSPE